MREDIVKIRAKVHVTVCAWVCKKYVRWFVGSSTARANVCGGVQGYDMCR